MARLRQLFFQLYPKNPANKKLLRDFIDQLPPLAGKTTVNNDGMVVYALYVDQFAKDFAGLGQRLDHIINLGANVLWLLPILKSPGLDQGFDISDYRQVRRNLGGNTAFFKFLKLAKSKRLKIIFDIALNHTSIQHPWFKHQPGFYIWSKSRDLYTGSNRVVFPHDPADPRLGPNDPRQKWVWNKPRQQYYYRTFYQHQPDLNYRNPEVLMAMGQVLAFWANRGVDGFRADAAPYLWKEKRRLNESLPQTHLILQFFQAVIATINPDAFILAEACQRPKQLLAYLSPRECRLAYHFSRMTILWQTLLTQDSRALTADINSTSKLPKGCDWLMFLRLHDELSLAMVPERVRKMLHQRLLPNGLDFRQGVDVSGRLASFLNNDPKKILFAWALMLVQPGVPIIFQGDDIGQTNNHHYFQKMKQMTGHDDSRYINRGPMAWNKINQQIYTGLKRLIQFYRRYHFDRATLQLIKTRQPQIFSCWRSFKGRRVLCRYDLKNYSFTWSRVTIPPARVES
ncbi:MAG: alpha-amylase family glycosyl hydrolase [Candidatus Beckwithbacteria bacterium]|nr:alpha-amylase family glycosyl hydrolase [Candidatus Beckwithbacteria bacterium]